MSDNLIQASDKLSDVISMNQRFGVTVIMNNHTSAEPYQLPVQNIIEFVIEEDEFSWPYRGYLIYNNQYEAIERNTTDNPWYYRMDARDELSIKIKMIDTDADNPIFSKDPEMWEIDLDMVIYNTEDMPSSNNVSKSKKIYFWDKKYQMMRENKKQWSTATAQQLSGIAHLPDSDRAMLTGEAIKYLLTSKDTCGFENSIDEDNWDLGATKTLYTSPANASLYDDLEYIFDRHVSTDGNDFCMFGYSDRTINRKFQLIPMSSIFKKAGKQSDKPGELAIETFWFESIEPTDEKSTTPLRAPHSQTVDFKIDLDIPEWNKITTYDFVDMSGIDNSMALVSRPVYGYDLQNKAFTVDVEDNEISNVREDFNELYISELAPNGNSGAIFPLNKTKTDQYAIDPQFVYYKSSDFGANEIGRRVYGKLKTLRSAVFTNEFIQFTVNGSPHRTCGKFIAIEKNITNFDLNFDNKICGQWYITNVKHIWSLNRYVNVINAVKINSYFPIKINEDYDFDFSDKEDVT